MLCSYDEQSLLRPVLPHPYGRPIRDLSSIARWRGVALSGIGEICSSLSRAVRMMAWPSALRTGTRMLEMPALVAGSSGRRLPAGASKRNAPCVNGGQNPTPDDGVDQK